MVSLEIHRKTLVKVEEGFLTSIGRVSLYESLLLAIDQVLLCCSVNYEVSNSQKLDDRLSHKLPHLFETYEYQAHTI